MPNDLVSSIYLPMPPPLNALQDFQLGSFCSPQPWAWSGLLEFEVMLWVGAMNKMLAFRLGRRVVITLLQAAKA